MSHHVASEIHHKKPLDFTQFQFEQQIENNMFPIPLIIRFTC